MIKTDELTDKVIKIISEYASDVSRHIIRDVVHSRFPNINFVEIEKQLSVLTNLDIIKIENNIVIKTTKFSSVLQAKNIAEFLDKQNESLKRDNEFKNMQLEEQKIKNKYIERQYKMQHMYFILALSISLVALLVASLAYLKK